MEKWLDVVLIMVGIEHALGFMGLLALLIYLVAKIVRRRTQHKRARRKHPEQATIGKYYDPKVIRAVVDMPMERYKPQKEEHHGKRPD